MPPKKTGESDPAFRVLVQHKRKIHRQELRFMAVLYQRIRQSIVRMRRHNNIPVPGVESDLHWLVEIGKCFADLQREIRQL